MRISNGILHRKRSFRYLMDLIHLTGKGRFFVFKTKAVHWKKIVLKILDPWYMIGLESDISDTKIKEEDA